MKILEGSQEEMLTDLNDQERENLIGLLGLVIGNLEKMAARESTGSFNAE
ncbi:MAG TPA: hypothetical protein VIT91_14850 [Chthoniobacterales bacterium]